MVRRKKIDPLNVKPGAQKFITRLVAAILTVGTVLSMYSSCAVTAMLVSKKKSVDPILLFTSSSNVAEISENYLRASLSARADSDPMNVRGVVDGRDLPDLPEADQTGFTAMKIYLRSQRARATTLKMSNTVVPAKEWVSVFGAEVASANSDKGQTRFYIVRCLQVGSTFTVLSLPSPTAVDPLKKLVLDPVYSKPIPKQSALFVAMNNFVTNYFLIGDTGGHNGSWQTYVSKNFDTSIGAPDSFTKTTITSILSTTNFLDTGNKMGRRHHLQINLQGFNGSETFSIFSVFVTAILSSDNKWVVDSLDDFIALQ